MLGPALAPLPIRGEDGIGEGKQAKLHNHRKEQEDREREAGSQPGQTPCDDDDDPSFHGQPACTPLSVLYNLYLDPTTGL